MEAPARRRVNNVSQAEKCRKSIYDLINQYTKKLELESDWQVLLDLIRETASVCPEAFLATTQHSGGVPNKEHDFVLWVIGGLLRVVALSNSTSFQKDTVHCLQKIFLLVKLRDHVTFCYVLHESVQMAVDLTDLCHTSATISLHYPLYLSHFVYTWNDIHAGVKQASDVIKESQLDYEPQLIELHSYKHVDSALQAVLRIAVVFCTDIWLFCPIESHGLYDVVCSALECGSFEVKKGCLDLLKTLVTSRAFTRLSVLDHAIECVVSMLSHVTVLLLSRNSVPIELEKSLSSCLLALFSPKEGEPCAVLRLWSYLLTQLQLCLVNQVYPLMSSELQVCVGDLLLKCFQFVSDINVFEVETVISGIGMSSNLQPLVPFLCHVLQAELSQPKLLLMSENVSIKSSTDKPTMRDLGKCKFYQRPSELVKINQDFQQLAPLAFKLNQKMVTAANTVLSLLESGHLSTVKQFEQVLSHLEGVRVGLEVYSALCGLSFEKTSLFLSIPVDHLGLLCQCWERALNAVVHCDSYETSSQSEMLKQVLEKIINSVGAGFVISTYSPGSVSSVILDRCVWIALLPWPQPSQSSLVTPFLDGVGAGSTLNTTECQLVKDTVMRYSSILLQVKCSSLYSLAVYHAHTIDSQRINVFCYALKETSHEVLSTVIKILPVFLTSLESSSVSAVIDSLCEVRSLSENHSLQLVKQLPAVLIGASKEDLEKSFVEDNFQSPAHQSCTISIPASIEAASYRIDGTVLSSLLGIFTELTNTQAIVALVESFAVIVQFTEDVSAIQNKCLALFTHGDIQVRSAITAHVQRLFFLSGSPDQDISKLEQHPVIVRLKEAYLLGARNEDSETGIRLQEFTVNTFGQIGRFAQGNLLITCLVTLLKFIFEPTGIVKSAARMQILRIAKSHDLSPNKLLSSYKEPICQFMVELLHEKEDLTLGENKKTNIFCQVALAFAIKEVKTFLESVRDILVPRLVCRATEQASNALKFLAKKLNTNVRKLLVESFKHVFLYVIMNGQQQDLSTAAHFLKSQAEFEMTELLCTDAKNILNLLLLHLSTHRSRIIAGVQILAEMEHKTAERRAVVLDTEERIANYLHPHLHGVVAFFNFMLVRLDFFENNAKGLLAIGSLIEVMRLMGPKYITGVKMKVLAMLRHCLTFKDQDVIKLTLSAWNCFVRCVNVDSLGPLLGQIVVALSAFVDIHPEKVAEIFEFLIVDNRSVLSTYFNEIYLLPDSPVLSDVNEVLHQQSQSPKTLHEQIRHVLKGVVHERSDVRLHALKALHKLLRSNRHELEKFMVGSDTVDPIITEVITTILTSLRGSSVELREEYGKCLGEVGAIDPGKLDISIATTAKIVRVYEVNGEFAVELFGELVRAYLAATNTRSQDCCAYAMQEVLLMFDCSNADLESEGARLWSCLSTDCQEVLRPHLTSSYSASPPKVDKIKSPIFGGTSKDISFHEWIQKWCTLMIYKLSDDLPKSVFLPCSLIFQHDRSPALYLLPHVLTCLLRTSEPGVTAEVYNEVMAVLKHCAQNWDNLPEHADSTNMCAQSIFTALDHLTAWAVGKNKAAVVRKVKGQPQKGNLDEIKRVKDFLDSIPKDILSQCAYRCQAYTRALMYLESFLNANPDMLQKNLGFLQKIYVALDDSDGVGGVAAVRVSEPSLMEQILQYESTGNYRDAAACYEQAIQQQHGDLSLHEGLLRCMMRQGEFTFALMHVNGLQTKRPSWMHRLNAYRVEATWKLGQWEELEGYLKSESGGSKNWDVNLGRLLFAAKKKDFKTFRSRVGKVRSEQMGPLCTASLEQGSYQRAYEYIVRLHMLQELEDRVKYLVSQTQSSGEHTFLNRWQARFELTQESFRTQEPILSLRRVVLGLESSKLDKEIGKSWLRSAKIAHRGGHFQAALSFLLNAKSYNLPEFPLQWAEYKKKQKSSHEALLSLQKAVADQWPAVLIDGAGESATGNSTHAEALLLIGRWMEDTAHYDTHTVLKQYKTVISVQTESEDGHFYLGKYYDRLKSVLANDRPVKSAEFLQFIIRHYGRALLYGNKYIYQCMPRMLTLWLDFGSVVSDSVTASSSSTKKSQERESKTLKSTLSQLNEQMKFLVEKLPPYQFLIAFSQLISRICHPNSDVFVQLEAIILKLLEQYPQQALWMMIAVSKSTHTDRKSRCKEIFDKAMRDFPHIGKLIDDMVKLGDKLLEMCNKPVEAKSYSMDRLCRGLSRLTSSSNFSAIMVPLQQSMTVTLPAGSGSSKHHNPFPGDQPTIVKFVDKVEVLASLQKPKKITVLASDGSAYVLLCKPKDDLRKDARLMEFNTLVNKCLRKDQDSRQRRLYIRTYAVIPLNEECGLLEWVPNTHGLRNILHKLYQEKGVYVSGRELRDFVASAGKDLERKKEIFLKQLLPKHPPVFGEWFLRTFPDPTAWYSSRLAYAHTVAVMSMVGYILGLGDRHGENILFDSTSGDCVHVDFNCLFFRGETFDVPEVVPFRLTQNMVHGMGVTKYEGTFRKSCEATMKVLRQECDALICVLKTFIHDPLVEWEKAKGRALSSEATNEKAVKIVHDIEDRLQGKYSKAKGLPLSIEGQVHALIKAATDESNLSQMYIGWAAYL